MKKIYTLMVAIGLVGLASAQQGNQKSISFNQEKDDLKKTVNSPSKQSSFDKGKTSAYETYSFSAREKDAQIQRINREYDQKISAVKRNWRLKTQEKSKQIRMLENQRSQEIKEVQLRWEKSNHRNNGKGRH
jgi:hypothetical protein